MSELTKSRWERVSEIFELALQHEPEARAALIESECAGDADVQREVEELIDAHEASRNFMAQPILGDAAATLPYHEDNVSYIGRRIGAYKVISELGRGGMGIVCLAARDDEHYQNAWPSSLSNAGWIPLRFFSDFVTSVRCSRALTIPTSRDSRRRYHRRCHALLRNGICRRAANQ